MKKIFIIMFLTVLAACVTDAERNAKFEKWVGKPAIDLVRHAGPPQKIVDGPGGHRWYVYMEGHSVKADQDI